MSHNIDYCRFAFEKHLALHRLDIPSGKLATEIERRDVMDRDRYADSRLEEMWRMFKAGYETRQDELLQRAR